MITGREVLQNKGRRHVELADGIEVGDVDGGHAEGAEQQKIERVPAVDPEQRAVAPQQPQKKKNHRGGDAQLHQLKRGDPAREQKLRCRGARGPARGGKDDEEISQPVGFSAVHGKRVMASCAVLSEMKCGRGFQPR